MKNKSFSSKLEELKQAAPSQLDVERKLIPRLKLMGYVMFAFCAASMLFAFIVKDDTVITRESLQETGLNADEMEAVTTPLSDDSELELAATEVLNFYAVSFVFAVVGASCFVIAWKKSKTLLHEPTAEKETY